MNDLISRKAAIEALRYAQHRFTVADEAGGMGTVKWSENVIYFDAAVNALSLLPSAQPERKKGKWILYDLQDENEVANDNFYYVCSCCGASDLHAKSMKVPFCWKCGARMRGEEDE